MRESEWSTIQGRYIAKRKNRKLDSSQFAENRELEGAEDPKSNSQFHTQSPRLALNKFTFSGRLLHLNATEKSDELFVIRTREVSSFITQIDKCMFIAQVTFEKNIKT